MKMSKENFNKLRDSIDTELSKYSLSSITEHRTYIKFVKDQFISFCWSIFYASKFDCKELYDSGLNDSHIETALKNILSNYK